MAGSGLKVVFGGSFNPPHMGHQMVCLYLLEAVGVERVWVVPAFRHPFGKPLAPFEHRLEMCRRMVAVFGDRASVLATEQELGGEGRTYDLLAHLGRENPQANLGLAVGADILGETHNWHRWGDIEQMVRIVVVGRMGYDAGGRGLLPLPEVSSTDVRRRLAAGEQIEGLLPGAVATYIAEQGLYRRE